MTPESLLDVRLSLGGIQVALAIFSFLVGYLAANYRNDILPIEREAQLRSKLDSITIDVERFAYSGLREWGAMYLEEPLEFDVSVEEVWEQPDYVGKIDRYKYSLLKTANLRKLFRGRTLVSLEKTRGVLPSHSELILYSMSPSVHPIIRGKYWGKLDTAADDNIIAFWKGQDNNKVTVLVDSADPREVKETTDRLAYILAEAYVTRETLFDKDLYAAVTPLELDERYLHTRWRNAMANYETFPEDVAEFSKQEGIHLNEVLIDSGKLQFGMDMTYIPHPLYDTDEPLAKPDLPEPPSEVCGEEDLREIDQE